MENYIMDLTIVTAIGAFTATFFGALLTLILICNRSRRNSRWERLEHNVGIKQRQIKGSELALAFFDIDLGNSLEHLIKNQQWVDDISGIIPHCLTILRTCHSLTEILAKLAMTKRTTIKESATPLIEAAKRIPSRVGAVLQAMYPPLDSRLLEARMETLVLALNNLASLTQSTVGINNRWIDHSLHEIEELLSLLKTKDYLSEKFAYV